MNQSSMTVSSLNLNPSILSQWSCDEYFCLTDHCEEDSLWFGFDTVGFSVDLMWWEAELLILFGVFAVLWTSSYLFSKPKSPDLLPCSVGRPLSIFVAPYVCSCVVCGMKQWQILQYSIHGWVYPLCLHCFSFVSSVTVFFNIPSFFLHAF